MSNITPERPRAQSTLFDRMPYLRGSRWFVPGSWEDGDGNTWYPMDPQTAALLAHYRKRCAEKQRLQEARRRTHNRIRQGRFYARHRTEILEHKAAQRNSLSDASDSRGFPNADV